MHWGAKNFLKVYLPLVVNYFYLDFDPYLLEPEINYEAMIAWSDFL